MVSLRRRLLLVLAMAGVALFAAILALSQVVAESDAVRTRNAVLTVRGMLERLRVDAARAVGDYPDAAVGTCSRGVLASTGGRGERNDHPLPPDLRDAVMALCGEPGRTLHIVHPHDATTLSAQRFDEGTIGWALWRVHEPSPREHVTWVWTAGLLVVATLVLALTTVGALRSIRGGADMLSRSLVSLRDDLRAPVEQPAAEELAQIAAGLSTMATHLADSRDRERALERSLAHEQRLSALGRVVAGVAHEVRNPLAGLKLRLDILRRGKQLGMSELGEVEGALDEVARLDRLVTLLLSTSRKPALVEEIALDTLIDARIARLDRPVTRRGSATVRTDRDAVIRIVDNLLRNAIEASSRDVVVEIAEREHVTVEVRDRGPGVVDPTALFEPFSTTKPGGVGLGLFLARVAAESVGGTLAYRRDDDWTVLCLTLPRS